MKKFKTVLIGNGLGRSIDDDYFSLSTGVKKAWENLNKKERNEIRSLLRSSHELPSSEEEIQALHEILEPLEQLITRAPDNWLSGTARQYPALLNRFITSVALSFFKFQVPEKHAYGSWLDHFTSFVRNESVHVATLNYDTLLYGHFIDPEVKICDGYNGRLIDGFWSDGFKPENLVRHDGKKHLGFYLHLHGSPLFCESGEQKLLKVQLVNPGVDLNLKRHLILAHPIFKQALIAESKLLYSYFEKFWEGLLESSELVIFGYGGRDPHVNEVIKRWVHQVPGGRFSRPTIKVIERREDGSTKEREEYWRSRLFTGRKCNVRLEILQYDSILEHLF